MKDLKRHRIGLKATVNLLAVLVLLTLSVGSTVWLIEGQTRRLSTLHQFLLALEVLGLIAVGAMAYLFHVRVLSPLKTLTRDAVAIADGDLDREIEQVNRDDEIGSLTRAVQEMRDQLFDHIEETKTFERAVEETGNAVVITDSNETIEYVNPAFERITGYSEAEALGKTPRILASGETDEEVYEDMWETISAGETWKGELVNRRKTGERQYVQQTIAPIERDGGSTEKYVSISANVTDQKLRNQVLEVFNRVLRHNLRNRVNVVTGNAELVRDRYARRLEQVADDIRASTAAPDGGAVEPDVDMANLAETVDEIAESVHEHTDMVVEAGLRLQELNEKASKADTVTQFTEESGGEQPLSEHLRTERDRVQQEFPEGNITLSIPDAPTIPCKESMRTALSELIENAVEHNDTDEPHVDLTMDVRSESVVVTVADDGPGIPEHERAVLREGEETPLSHGSGLGLWLVYWIVTMNGGRLQIEDREPRGTAVKLFLPLPRGGTETVADGAGND
ncbi:sensor histidine kinase [Halanaeroarchaeum sulfurireducens]|uniref:histidine kinase n=1 Tax=Halanaeroarchaeum sulfurireducens TaxID=1604004 RepID=A0A0F7P6H4_9EURY|nr:PAS domain S-box protein [Halanaeroarchaeum sulfurireducens]AKH96761.1 signal-transducing histidine kinase/response regulator [Halanaeroarchaeum sulfurireducens]ALG81163.1 signal-transducing histidine kinase/response regulator [Halanaeroarchaeum sulfurireducens]